MYRWDESKGLIIVFNVLSLMYSLNWMKLRSKIKNIIFYIIYLFVIYLFRIFLDENIK